MSRSLASIQTIDKITEIPKANSIELITFKNIAWQCVAKKGEFKSGDFCVYFEIDSLLPKENPVFAFMESRKFKVKTVKFMSEYLSQGLALPISAFPELSLFIDDGKDVTELLNITKYDNEDPDECIDNSQISLNRKNYGKFRKAVMKYKIGRTFVKYFLGNKPASNFPVHICSVTDETRIQNLKSLFETAKGQVFFVSEKLEGQSSTFALEKSTFGRFNFYVCSRERCYPTKTSNNFWYISDKYNMREYLKNIWKEIERELEYTTIKSIAIQAEIVGPGVQKNIYNLKDLEAYVFNIIVNYSNGNREKLTPVEIDSILKSTANTGKPILKVCPILYNVILGETEGTRTIEELLEYAESNSVMCIENVLREGIVFRSIDMQYSFKAVSNAYLLKRGY